MKAGRDAGRPHIGTIWRRSSFNAPGGKIMLLRLLLGTSTLFISFVLGAIALVYVGVHAPWVLDMMLGWARAVKDMITGTALDEHYNIWVKFLLEEQQLVFMFFTIGARIVLGLIGGLFTMMTGR
jgi:hypothetical protein